MMPEKQTEDMTEFKIVWCVMVAIALVGVFMDIFVWRATI